jgi:hypothetical protein
MIVAGLAALLSKLATAKALARRPLEGSCLVLCEVSSSCVEGRCCELARLGHVRAGKKGRQQIIHALPCGLLSAADGCLEVVSACVV